VLTGYSYYRPTRTTARSGRQQTRDAPSRAMIPIRLPLDQRKTFLGVTIPASRRPTAPAT
jgi:hypothetical protein